MSGAPLPPELNGLNLDGLLGSALASASAETLTEGLEEVRFLAQGGMGTVYRARQPKLGRTVAVKVLAPELAADAAFAERFRREAMTMARLAHPHIAAVFDTGLTDDGLPYYVMEYVEGGDLARRLKAGRLPVAESVRILREALAALEHAHSQDVVHRDVKPSNLLLTPDGHVKVADFGLAAPAAPGPETRLTRTGSTLGTLEYAAPEQIEGRSADARSDLYSLGVIAYELLTGSLPRGAFEPPSANGGDWRFDDVVARALAREPDRRFPSAAAFADALNRAASREANVWKLLQRRNRVALAVGILALLAGAGAFVAWRQSRVAHRHAAASVQARQDAERLVDYMLNQLRNRLTEVSRLDLMEDVVDRVGAYFQSAPAAEDDADLQRIRASWLEARGVVHRVKGQADEADEALTAATDIRRRFAAQNPSDLRWQSDLAAGLRQLYDLRVRWKKAGSDEEAVLVEIAEVRARIAAAKADSHTAAIDLIRARRDLAEWRLANHDAPGAAASVETVRTGLAAVRARHGETNSVLWEHADLLVLESRLLLESGATTRAIALASEALSTFERLSERKPNDLFVQGRISFACENLGKLLGGADRWAEALPVLQRGADIAATLADRSPKNAESQKDTAAQWQRVANAHEALGNAEAAKAASARASGFLSRISPTAGSAALAEAEAAAWARLTDTASLADHVAWADAAEKVGYALYRKEQPDPALDWFRQCQARLEPHLGTTDGIGLWHWSFARTLNRLGAIHEERRDWTEATAAYRHALDLRKKLAASQPRERQFQRDLLSSFGHAADVCLARQDTPGLLSLAGECLDLFPILDRDSSQATAARLLTEWAETIAKSAPDEASRLAAKTLATLFPDPQQPPPPIALRLRALSATPPSHAETPQK